MTKTEKATFQMESWANDDSHGYDQVYRWGEKGDYDCSSAVISAWEAAGVPVKTKGGATYTGNMRAAFIKYGFEDVTAEVNRANGAGMKRGDVLLNEAHHTAMYCGDGMEVEASINEKGTATGGKQGDQTGKEFLIRPYRNYPWNCVLRFKESTAAPTPAPPVGAEKTFRVAYPARIVKDVKCYLGAGTGSGQSKLFPVLKKDALVDVMKHVEEDTNGNKWYLVRVLHPVEGFLFEFILAGSFTHLK